MLNPAPTAAATTPRSATPTAAPAPATIPWAPLLLAAAVEDGLPVTQAEVPDPAVLEPVGVFVEGADVPTAKEATDVQREDEAGGWAEGDCGWPWRKVEVVPSGLGYRPIGL